jgi:hypothetical protein
MTLILPDPSAHEALTDPVSMDRAASGKGSAHPFLVRKAAGALPSGFKASHIDTQTLAMQPHADVLGTTFSEPEAAHQFPQAPRSGRFSDEVLIGPYSGSTSHYRMISP